MKTCHWRASMVALLLGAGLLASTSKDVAKIGFPGFLSSAHAQPLRKLIARLRGQTLPAGIAKAEGRIEATQADVSSKYPGQLAELSVEEGTKVAIGQAVGRVSSPEFEARLRGAQSDLQSAQDGLAGAEAEIASRRSALVFAKSDFERGQALMKSGFITKQAFEELQRNYKSAEAAVQNMTSRRDQAQSAITAAEANVQQIEAMIQDLTLVSPRNGQVQYQLARKGETVAAGEPIVTILDLTDLYMVIFLNAADSGRLGIGDEARVILDPVPDYVIPAEVSFVASDAQFTPKTVETEAERTEHRDRGPRLQAENLNGGRRSDHGDKDAGRPLKAPADRIVASGRAERERCPIDPPANDLGADRPEVPQRPRVLDFDANELGRLAHQNRQRDSVHITVADRLGEKLGDEAQPGDTGKDADRA